MLDKNYVYAVVGASNDHTKYGYKVYKDLLDAGYTVVPINPSEKEIEGQTVYPTLTEAMEVNSISVVVTVVPPKITSKIMDEVLDLGIRFVWMQPGSEDEESIQIAEESGIEVVSGSCIMIEKTKN